MSNHGICDACEIDDKRWNGLLWIDQSCILVYNLFSVKKKDRNFGNSLTSVAISSGFYVNNGIQMLLFFSLTRTDKNSQTSREEHKDTIYCGDNSQINSA